MNSINNFILGILFILFFGGLTIVFPLWLFLIGNSLGVWNLFWTCFMFVFSVFTMTAGAINLEKFIEEF